MSITNHLLKLDKRYSQTGGGGIPFSAMNNLNTNHKSRRTRRTRRTRSRPRRTRSRPRMRSRTRKKGQLNQLNQSKKKCKCGIHSYTGNESSPRGLGICEICTPTLVVMKGKDGSLYENRNNIWIPF